MKKERLDVYLTRKDYAISRSQSENLIRLGGVSVNGQKVTKPGHYVSDKDTVTVRRGQTYVSRAALKLESVAGAFSLEFSNKTVLDIGSSTGGFTDYALQNGAKKVIAVDVGTNQLHPSLRDDVRIELHEKTDIRNFRTEQPIDIILVDVSFISISKILEAILSFCHQDTLVVAMVKPQFETITKNSLHKGVIKNSRVRRDILNQLESTIKQYFKIINSQDSGVAGTKGNEERFYLLKPTR